MFADNNKLQQREGLERRVDLVSEEISKLIIKIHMKNSFEKFFTISGTDSGFSKLVFLWNILKFPQASKFVT